MSRDPRRDPRSARPTARIPSLASLALPAGLCCLAAAACTSARGSLPDLSDDDETLADDDSASENDDDSSPDETPAGVARVLLSELMYHPVLEESYEDEHEFIEITNAGTAPANLLGWRFDDGVDFEFPERILLPGDSLLVVANPAAIGDFYGIPDTSIAGQYGGHLDNSGERVRLVDADGETADELNYEDRLPWPLGPDALGAGADWLPLSSLPLSAHQFGGRSLQRRSFDAGTDDPGNWVASALDGADPGTAASVDEGGALATVRAIRWGGGKEGFLPPFEPLLLEVQISGKIENLRVEWYADPVAPGGGSDIDLADLRDDGLLGDPAAGDGWFGTELPARPEESVLRIRIRGDGGDGDDVLSPREGDPMGWHAVFVGTPLPGNSRAYRLYIDPNQWTALWDAVDDGRVLGGCTPNPGWDLDVPAVFVDEGGAVYDVRARYQGSRWNRTNGRNIWGWSVPGPDSPDPLRALSWNLRFPRYDRFDGRGGIMLNKLTQSCPGLSTAVGLALFDSIGIPVPEVRYARFFVNGAYYNYTQEIERPAEEMLERWLDTQAESEPGVPHLFKSSGCNCDEGPYGWGDERPLEAFCGYSADERYEWTYERKTWDWAGPGDLRAMIEGLDLARAGSDEDLRAFLDATFDVDAVLSYLAVINWAAPFDDMFQNHYLVQRRSNGRWFFAPWDLDLDFGGWNDAWSSLYIGEAGDPSNRAGWWNRWKDAFLQVYRAEFEARLLELDSSVLDPQSVSDRVDEVAASWDLDAIAEAPAGFDCSFPQEADDFKAFAWNRHAVVLDRLGP
jgi:hypothetical protein